MRSFMRKHKRQWNQWISCMLAMALVIGIPMVGSDFFYATPEQDKNQASSELGDINSEIKDIEENQYQVNEKLNETAQLLTELMAEQAILEQDIAETQVAIDETAVALEAAKQAEAEGYEAMVLRIQYMYENSTVDSFWEAIIHAKGLSDMLNRIEYVAQVHQKDRDLMAEYAKTVEEVKSLAESLEIEMNNLLTLQENYEHQQLALEETMAKLKADKKNYATQLALAKAEAVRLAEYIEEQNRLIREEEERRRKEEEERKRKEEEERKRKEEEEKKRKEEEEKKRQEEAAKKESEEAAKKESEEGGNNSDTGNNSGGGNGTEKEPEESDSEYVDPDPNTLSGEDIVAYALKFVGNPYVWAGNSLTHGCDCSGFVNLIYKHFGFEDVPRQSQSFKRYGKAVSFKDIQPGDIVVYPGHVAIYIGNGKIVEAQSPRTGITRNRSVTSGTITAIRRVIGYEEREE